MNSSQALAQSDGLRARKLHCRPFSAYAVCAAVVLLALLPAFLSSGLLDAANQMLIAILFASAFNVLAGQGGMLSFGHAAYFGIGAFATIHAMNALGGNGLLPTPLLPVFGALAGGVLGVMAGWFSTQRTGVYFSMITLALAELIHALAPQMKSVFGGEAGVSSMRMPAWGFDFGSNVQVYYLTLAWLLASLALLYSFTRTPLGRLALGLRENSHRLKFLGYNVHRLRLLVFIISSTFTGVAGGLQAITNESANYVLFDVSYSADVVLNSYIGGVGTFFGPAIGSALMTFFGYITSDLTRSWLLYQGILFILIIMFMPAGLSGLLPWWQTQYRTLPAKQLVPLMAASVLAAALMLSGSIFSIELLQRAFSQDYKSLLIAGQPWPAIPLFGYSWNPEAVLTWSIPLLLLALGGWVEYATARKWNSASENKQYGRPSVQEKP
jgi:branched-chain amino acid transport system permease protein